ncbi:MAG: pantoate--beta-alanine ligase [Candidatus Goldbacteria bacterium]|nr:pantoate--beta-alanine ligase [Candidatus Goldiibacteriota bacterium]
MKIINSISDMHDYIDKIKRNKKNIIGFIPTMGALHDGHLSLIHAAAKDCNKIVVSIFVNPIQFGPSEDFNKYPRDIKKDTKLLRSIKKVNCVFIPDVNEMYPPDYATYVQLENEMPKVLCGISRPTHFKGVTTVVCKLLNIVKPDKLYLGQKDMQQAVILKKMIKDLNYKIDIIICPIIREKDGLAMSSRNVYLTPDERNIAPILRKALQIGESMIELGEKDPQVIIKEIKRKIKETDATIDYVEIVDPETLLKKERISGKVLIAAAIFVGNTRLIDNTIVETKDVH